jgi:hypothetical protein
MAKSGVTFTSDEINEHKSRLLAFSKGSISASVPAIDFNRLELGVVFASLDRGFLLRVVTQICEEEGVRRVRCKTVAKMEFDGSWTFSLGVEAGEGTFIGKKTWDSGRSRTAVFTDKLYDLTPKLYDPRPTPIEPKVDNGSIQGGAAQDDVPVLIEIRNLLRILIDEVRTQRNLNGSLTEIYNALMGPSGVPYLGRLCDLLIREDERKKKERASKNRHLEQRHAATVKKPIKKKVMRR